MKIQSRGKGEKTRITREPPFAARIYVCRTRACACETNSLLFSAAREWASTSTRIERSTNAWASARPQSAGFNWESLESELLGASSRFKLYIGIVRLSPYPLPGEREIEAQFRGGPFLLPPIGTKRLPLPFAVLPARAPLIPSLILALCRSCARMSVADRDRTHLLSCPIIKPSSVQNFNYFWAFTGFSPRFPAILNFSTSPMLFHIPDLPAS